MKTFLRPTLPNLLLTFLLFLVSSYLWRMYVMSTISDTFPWGFPLQFYLGWGPCPPGEICSESNTLFLILDLVFWYSVSALVLSRFGKLGLEKEQVQKARQMK